MFVGFHTIIICNFLSLWELWCTTGCFEAILKFSVFHFHWYSGLFRTSYPRLSYPLTNESSPAHVFELLSFLVIFQYPFRLVSRLVTEPIPRLENSAKYILRLMSSFTVIISMTSSMISSSSEVLYFYSLKKSNSSTANAMSIWNSSRWGNCTPDSSAMFR